MKPDNFDTGLTVVGVIVFAPLWLPIAVFAGLLWCLGWAFNTLTRKWQ